MARFNGQEVDQLRLPSFDRIREVNVAKRPRPRSAKLDAEPDDIDDRPGHQHHLERSSDSYHASVEALLLGAGLAVLVVFIFLRDWRATLITAMAMPLSLIPAFAVMDPRTNR